MKKRKIIAFVLISILLATNICWWQAWRDWRQEEETLKSQLVGYQQSFMLAKKTLDDTQLQFADFKKEADDNLQNIGLELEDTKSQLKNAVDHVFLVAGELKTVQGELETVRVELTSQETYYEDKLLEEVQEAKRVGYQEAMAKGKLLRNFTYAGLIEFLKGFTALSWETASCLDYAASLNNTAEENGFGAGLVFLVFSYINDGKWGHFLNAFETTDRGIVFIEPQTLEEVRMEIGQYYIHGSSSDIVREIVIVW